MLKITRASADAPALPALKGAPVKAVAVAFLLALGACQGGAQNTGVAVAQDAAVVAQVTLSPADLAQVKQTCATAAPALDTATAPGVPATLSGTAIYPKALCDQLTTGIVPPTVNASTPKWLATVLAATQDAASIASVVLPIALKALPLVAALL